MKRYILYLKNMSHQKMYKFWYCAVNDEVPLTSSKIAEQTEVIHEVILLRISKLNDSALEKKQGDLTQFFQKKTIEKGNWIWYSLLFSLLQQLMDRVIE